VVSPIALQSRCKHVPNKRTPMYGHSWRSTPESAFEIEDRQSEEKWSNCDGRVICNTTRGIDAWRGVSRNWDVSDSCDRPGPM